MDKQPKQATFDDLVIEDGEGLVYFITDGTAVKIGHTTKAVTERLAQLQTGNPRVLTVLRTMPGSLEDEKRLHDLFAGRLMRPNSEWFAIHPWEVWGFDSPQAMGVQNSVVVGSQVSKKSKGLPKKLERRLDDVRAWFDESVYLCPAGGPEHSIKKVWDAFDGWRKDNKIGTLGRVDFEKILETIHSPKDNGKYALWLDKNNLNYFIYSARSFLIAEFEKGKERVHFKHLYAKQSRYGSKTQVAELLKVHLQGVFDVNHKQEKCKIRIEHKDGSFTIKCLSSDSQLLKDHKRRVYIQNATFRSGLSEEDFIEALETFSITSRDANLISYKLLDTDYAHQSGESLPKQLFNGIINPMDVDTAFLKKIYDLTGFEWLKVYYEVESSGGQSNDKPDFIADNSAPWKAIGGRPKRRTFSDSSDD